MVSVDTHNTVGPADSSQAGAPGSGPLVEFRVAPESYKHWRIAVDGPVATLTMDVDEHGGLQAGYELKLNSYDLGVDIELYDAVQRLRFEHPEVRVVVVTSGKDKIFCADANIRMLAAAAHSWKVNFCKFTNETRTGIEDATTNSGQTYVAALNGTASGGGYGLALACAYPLALTRELDDLILDLRTNEPELGTWVFRTAGEQDRVLAYDQLLLDNRGDWLVNEIVLYLKRTLKRLDVTSRSLIALIEPGSCYAGLLLELGLAADRSYMLAGVFEDIDQDATPAVVTVGEMNLGPLPMGNGLTRLQARFLGDDAALAAIREQGGEPLEAEAAGHLGLVTFTPDDIDWEEEVRIVLEERASFSPDALTGLEANYRFAGPETMETKIFGRLTAWQNWIFYRPNASGPNGALRRFGTGQRADFDRKRAAQRSRQDPCPLVDAASARAGQDRGLDRPATAGNQRQAIRLRLRPPAIEERGHHGR